MDTLLQTERHWARWMDGWVSSWRCTVICENYGSGGTYKLDIPYT